MAYGERVESKDPIYVHLKKTVLPRLGISKTGSAAIPHSLGHSEYSGV